VLEEILSRLDKVRPFYDASKISSKLAADSPHRVPNTNPPTRATANTTWLTSGWTFKSRLNNVEQRERTSKAEIASIETAGTIIYWTIRLDRSKGQRPTS
jgi:hypothetical protein